MHLLALGAFWPHRTRFLSRLSLRLNAPFGDLRFLTDGITYAKSKPTAS